MDTQDETDGKTETEGANRDIKKEPEQRPQQKYEKLPQEKLPVTVEGLRTREPGADPVDPYADVDYETLPEWWATAIAEFEERNLRTYQPSRLADGAVVETVIADFANHYDVSIRFIGKNVRYGDQWRVVVDGTPVSTVTHYRSPAGFSIFGLETGELEGLLREYVTQNA